MKRASSLILCVLMIFAILPFQATAYDNKIEVDITGYDSATTSSGVFVYPNNTSSVRSIAADEYNFSLSKLLVFTAEGKLIEAGSNIFANSDTVTGSPQLSVKVPAGGFLVAFGATAPSALNTVYTVAMEDAMLYNATMSIIYDVKGSYNTDTNKLTIEYNNPTEPSENAKRFMFIGNSSTYFNGTPIKFKGLALAAGIEIDVDYCTFGSANLAEFADASHERGIAMRNKLNNNEYDYVVLQDAARANYATTKPAVNTILPLIEANGAEALLYKRYSTGDTIDELVENSQKHHNNYSRIADDYGLVCAPAAEAFIYSRTLYPYINLYADDGGHHSKEGSYLIACVWLMSYLGVNPVGNSYIAELDPSVAAKLQECAKIAVENGYEYPKSKDTITIDGTEYDNIARGKSYESDGKRYNNAKWTDTGDDLKPLGKLTDGNFATAGDDYSVGAYNANDVIINGTKTKSINITIDLKSYSELKAFKTDLYGNSGWGIDDPSGATIEISISNDGKDFTVMGNAEMSENKGSGSWMLRYFTYSFPENTSARYVRITFLNTNYSWVSELSVYGIEGEEIIESETKSYALGDINMDENVNQYDYILAKRAHFNTITFDENQKLIGDMNGDGKNDQYDYILIKRIHFKNFSTEKTVEITIE